MDAFSLEAMADAIAELVRGIAADAQHADVSLVGYSLGGRLAMAVAAWHPDIAGRIAVVSGSPGLTGAAPKCMIHCDARLECNTPFDDLPHTPSTFTVVTEHVHSQALAVEVATSVTCTSRAGTGERAARAARDSRLADALLQGGLPAFVESWYRGPLWHQLRAHPGFTRIVQHRSTAGAAHASWIRVVS